MLSKCKTCLTLSEEVEFAAPGSVWESLGDPDSRLLQQNIGMLSQGRAVMFYHAVTLSRGGER